MPNHKILHEDDIREMFPKRIERNKNINIAFKFNVSDIFFIQNLNEFPILKKELKNNLHALVELNWHPVYSLHLLNIWCLLLNQKLVENKYQKKEVIKFFIKEINSWISKKQKENYIEEQSEERYWSIKYEDYVNDEIEQLNKIGLNQLYS